MTKPVNRPHKKPGPAPRKSKAPKVDERTSQEPRQTSQEGQEATQTASEGETTLQPVEAPTSPAPESLTELQKIMAGREGNPEKARTPEPGESARPGGKTPASGSSRTEAIRREEERQARREAQAELQQEAQDLAEILASGEAELAVSFVPEGEQQAKVERKATALLRTAWAYHFRKNGINLPSWLFLIIAHLGVGGMVAQPNRESIGGWASGLMNKLFRKKKELFKVTDGNQEGQ